MFDDSYTHNHAIKNRKILFFSLFTSFFLFIGKIFFGLLSGSVALLSSAIDSGMDIISSVINIFILHYASKPADEDHPYGHGKFEAFSSLLQGILIFISASSLLVYSLFHFFTPHTNEYEKWGIIVICISIVMPVIISTITQKAAKKSKSLVMESEHEHFLSDGIMNAGVLIGLIISSYFLVVWVDSLVAVFVSLFLIYRSFILFKISFEVLTDKELSQEVRQNVEKILNTSPEIQGWHCLRTRRSGMEYHMDVHLEFDKKISLVQAHDSADMVEKKILETIPNSIVLTHFDYVDDRK